ncbi:6-hydroxynicotinate 3-monooxygenase precursor [Devosia equisanguinis]|uniref:6-hydroxynicotinate 3-monooxygenase n=1 Tax=Devosia equisanguinis TaxID=2490941 RepID=A0A3S4C900_9HYPH|nr:FAD-dependent monooxygenase [Devosia equisanguinis]VDS02906.1 6-hydroxynicotinate 3-monooxygenase precursor [Devosia equisanguinis]
MRIAIVGAGVAGAIMARGLAQLPGLDVTCLERVAPDDQAEAGTGLNIGPNAVGALSRVDAELANAITAAALPWDTWRVTLTDGTELMNIRMRDVAPSAGWRLRWSELYRVLRQGADGLIRYGADITDMGPTGDGSGRTFLRWTDATGAHALDDIDLLIGVDGRFSKVRQRFAGDAKARQVGVAIFRTLLADTSEGVINDYEQWFNRDNRLLGFRVPPDHIYISGTFPISVGGDITDAHKAREALREAYTPSDGTLSEQGQWLVEAVCNPTTNLHWARLQESEVRIFEPDSDVLYLGDSSHGMVPTLGQGATQAIEGSCTALMVIRDLVAAGNFDPREWLGAVSDARAARIRFVMNFSLEASDTLLAGSDPVAGTLKKTEPAFQSKLKQLYHDFDATWPLQGQERAAQ